MAAPDSRTAYRTTHQSRVIIVGVLVYVVLWVVGVVDIATADDATTGFATRAVVTSLIAAHLVGVIWFGGFRCGRAAVLAGPADVIVRNPCRSQRVAWDSIKSFTVERNGAWTKGHLNTIEGSSIPIYGIQGQSPSLFPRSRWAERPISQLNRLLEEKIGRHTPEDGRGSEP